MRTECAVLRRVNGGQCLNNNGGSCFLYLKVVGAGATGFASLKVLWRTYCSLSSIVVATVCSWV